MKILQNLKLSVFSLALFGGVFSTALAQDLNYKTAANDENSNYYEIVDETRAFFLAEKEAKNGELTLADIKARKHFERWAFFWRDRVGADGSFPSPLLGWHNAGLLDKNNVPTKGPLNDAVWTNIGPQVNVGNNGFAAPPQLGRINAFWRYVDGTDPTNNVLLVGAPTGGIWKSTDNGATWAPKFDMFAGIGITDIKGSSSAVGTPGVLYASTGDLDGGSALNSIGVFKSTDMGDTWVACPGLSNTLSDAMLTGHLVVIDANTVVVGTTNTIKRTTDGGATWADVHSGSFSGQGFGRMASFGTNIVCSDALEGVSFSTDNGVTWTEVIQATGNDGKHAVAVDENGVFYAQTESGQLKQLDLTAPSASDIGVSTADYNAQGGYNQTLSVKNGFFVCGSVDGTNSNDNGASWFKSLDGYYTGSGPGIYVHSDHHQTGYLDAGLSFWDANDGGLYFVEYANSNDDQPTITYKTNGVIVTQSYAIAIVPNSATSDDFMMANQDNDGFSKESGTWVGASAGDGVCAAIDYSDPSVRYLGGTAGALAKSSGSTGFDGAYTGTSLSTPAGAAFTWPLSLHTSTPTTLYGGFGELNVSTDSGTSWSSLNSGAGQTESFDNQGSFLAVVGQMGTFHSSDAGSSWNSISSTVGAEINSFSIDASSTNGSTLYCSTREYVAGKKVYKSTDSGATWTNISGDLPNVMMKKVLFKQNSTQELIFVSTELGVYFTLNGGTNWEKLGSNLPNVIVNDMKINYMNQTMYIGTYGRGMWSADVSNSSFGLNETALDINVSIHPNPITNDELNVTFSEMNEEISYVIYNVVGGVIKRGTLSQLTNSINLNNAAQGSYILKLNSGNKVTTKKFIVQ